MSEYEIKYQPKLFIKGQVMTDFITKILQQPSQFTNLVGRDCGFSSLTEPLVPRDPK